MQSPNDAQLSIPPKLTPPVKQPGQTPTELADLLFLSRLITPTLYS